MKKALLILTVAILAAGCRSYDGRDGRDGQDGSLNMRVVYYEIKSQDWTFDPGVGPDGLNRHFYYTINRYMDPEIEMFLNERSFDELVIQIEREVEPGIMEPLPNTKVIEDDYNGVIEQHTETITYDYSINPSEIWFYFVDSRFGQVDYYTPPVTMRFRVVYMWP